MGQHRAVDQTQAETANLRNPVGDQVKKFQMGHGGRPPKYNTRIVAAA